MFDVLTSVLHFKPGETRTTEELVTAKCDVQWLIDAKAIRPVGFLSGNGPRSEEEQARIVNELQAKILKAEDEREAMRQERNLAIQEAMTLREAHSKGHEQLKLCEGEVLQLKAQLEVAKAKEQ